MNEATEGDDDDDDGDLWYNFKLELRSLLSKWINL